MTESTGRAPDAGPTDNEHDALTATLSRQAFVTRVAAYAERSLDDGTAFGVCLVDLDHFKNINLSHGPACGDDALRDIARRLVRTNFPELEEPTERIIGRYDGNAFGVLVATGCLEKLVAAAHTLHESVGDASSVTGSRLSASVGAVLARIGEDAGSVLVRAEQALYLAKQFGRDRVEIGRSPVPLRTSGDVLALRRSA
ncbi:MAG: GGDEF domain-containing protein [Gammaproteobacteria bacterium]|nr:GGDEF domain-containing protein [Gammaproteobacteria bacterium]MDH3506438.1 GGDEF domain-containing protein [Gammaproteobacteria bacterium]